MTSRTVFVATAGLVMATLLVLIVIRPAVERGGWGEIALIVGIFITVLAFERWLRTR